MRKRSAAVLLLVVLRVLSALAQAPAAGTERPGHPSSIFSTRICARCIRANMEFLASDALRGRGSGTADELVAATYIAAQLRAYGVEPAGDQKGYLQRAAIVRRKFTAAPQLRAQSDEQVISSWIYSRDFLALQLTQTEFSGPLEKIELGEDEEQKIEVKPGAVVLITSKGADKFEMRQAAFRAQSRGAVATLLAFPEEPEVFARDADLPSLPPELAGESRRMGGNLNLLELSAGAGKAMAQLADGTELRFDGPAGVVNGSTWNVLGILRGSDPQLRKSAIVLSAHLDHLGIGPPVNGDNIYNGADDDASGVSTVLELARALASGPRPHRTVIFALFGSEEAGGLGSTYFSEHPPVALADMTVDLEFEMIGRRDPAVPDDDVWLTGWERSDLGPTLKLHGAAVVPDPHLEQNFFARSDNYILAKKGVVAQTIGSFGLHEDYHQPSDDLAHIDFKHMDAVISGLIGPIEWLVNADYVPTWKKGGKP